MKPILYTQTAFDASENFTLNFVWEGDQAFSNTCIIRDNVTNNIVYQQNEVTMQLRHTIPENTLFNGNIYNIRVAVLDIDNNVSTYSDPIVCHCLATPTISITNITNNQIVQNSTYNVQLDYSQSNNELLQSFEVGLYDLSQNRIYSSGVLYSVNDLSYSLTNLEDNQSYYIRSTCMTVNGMIADTGYIYFSVNYRMPAVYSVITLENVKNQGYIKLQSNIRAVEAHLCSSNNVIYIANDQIDLRNDSIEINDDFTLQDDFVIMVSGYNLSDGLIMQLSDMNNNNIYINYRKGTYQIDNNIEKAFIEIDIPMAYTHYKSFSNHIDIPSSTDMLDIKIIRCNGLYDVIVQKRGA